MTKNRLEAFSDGVIAIILTIMVLDLRTPEGHDWAALAPVAMKFLGYVLSFVFIGIYWNNHHHMLHAVKEVGGGALWANLHLLFWLSLVPFTTSWAGEHCFQPIPVALYGGVLLMAGAAYYILVRALIHGHPDNRALADALGRDVKGKVSVLLYAAAIPLAFVRTWVALAVYVFVALMWLVPDRRIEKAVSHPAVRR